MEDLDWSDLHNSSLHIANKFHEPKTKNYDLETSSQKKVSNSIGFIHFFPNPIRPYLKELELFLFSKIW